MASRFVEGDPELVTHVGSVLINPDGMVPMGRHWRTGDWSLPKGGIEDRDHAAAYNMDTDVNFEAALREVWEEVGLDRHRIHGLDSLGVALRYSVGRLAVHHTEYFYGVTYASRGLRPRESDIIEARFFPLDEAYAVLHNPTDKIAVRYGELAVFESALLLTESWPNAETR